MYWEEKEMFLCAAEPAALNGFSGGGWHVWVSFPLKERSDLDLFPLLGLVYAWKNCV